MEIQEVLEIAIGLTEVGVEIEINSFLVILGKIKEITICQWQIQGSALEKE